MKEIQLTKEKIAYVDDADFLSLSQYEWYLQSSGYACRTIWIAGGKGKKIVVYMHRSVLSLETGDARNADHIDGNRLNNQRSNLRICTPAQNAFNRGAQKNNVLGIKGVSMAKNGKFVTYIKKGGKRISKGGFATADEAKKFYDKNAKELHGEFFTATR